MTRVTNDLRDNLEHQIMKDLPSRNYIEEIHALVQEIVVVHAPEKVRVMYDDPDLRDYLQDGRLEVKMGNKHVPMWQGKEKATDSIKGLTKGITIQMMDDAGRMTTGSLYQTLITTLKKSGLVAAYFAQDDLRVSVRNRLRANLRASGTFKQLYANLEPELHHYIPKDEVKAQVPACVAPVVDDLRKLGAVLPETPKA